MIVVLIETGLRGGDACTLEFSPIIQDSPGGPCLRFRNLKIGAEQLIPVSASGAAAIRSQQDHDRQRWPAGTPWLFPGISGNADGSKPFYHATLCAQLRRWQDVIDVRDEAWHARQGHRPPLPPHPGNPAQKARSCIRCNIPRPA